MTRPNACSTWVYFPPSTHPDGYNSRSWTVIPITDPQPQGYFFSHQTYIKLVPNSYGGGVGTTPETVVYCGMQTIGSVQQSPIAVMSAWGGSGGSAGRDPWGNAGIAGPFGEDGYGWSGAIPIPWTRWRRYDFHLAISGNTVTGTVNGWPIATISGAGNGQVGHANEFSPWYRLADAGPCWMEFYQGEKPGCDGYASAISQWQELKSDGLTNAIDFIPTDNNAQNPDLCPTYKVVQGTGPTRMFQQSGGIGASAKWRKRFFYSLYDNAGVT